MSSSIFFTVIEVDFQSTTFTGTEGESISICVVITRGSVELFGFVDVDFVTTDITATSMQNYLSCYTLFLSKFSTNIH